MTAVEGQRVEHDVSTLPASADARLSFFWAAHKYAEDNIKVADTKAGFAVAILSAFISTVIRSGINSRLLQEQLSTWTVLNWVSVAGFALMLSGVLLAVNVVRPRLHTTQHRGLIYWRAISNYTSSEFLAKSEAISESEILVSVVNHTHEIAEIASKKFTGVAWAMLLGAVGSLLAALAILLK